MKPYRGLPMTLESAAAAHLRLVVAGVNSIRPSRHAGMGQRRQCPNGAAGWSARNAAAAMSTWWSPGRSSEEAEVNCYSDHPHHQRHSKSHRAQLVPLTSGDRDILSKPLMTM
jgi:hypothetical protein